MGNILRGLVISALLFAFLILNFFGFLNDITERYNVPQEDSFNDTLNLVGKTQDLILNETSIAKSITIDETAFSTGLKQGFKIISVTWSKIPDLIYTPIREVVEITGMPPELPGLIIGLMLILVIFFIVYMVFRR